MSVNRGDFKKSPETLIKSPNGDIKKIYKPADTEIGQETVPANLTVNGQINSRDDLFVTGSAYVSGSVHAENNFSIGNRVVTVPTGTIVLSNQDGVVRFSSISGTFNVSLPSNPRNGQIVTLKDESGNMGTFPATVTDPNSKTIDGLSSHVMNTDYIGANYMYNSSNNWNKFVFSEATGSNTTLSSIWTTVYDVDFTSLASQTISSNGSVTIDSKTWTMENFANASSVTVGGADGMKFACNTTNSVYNTTTRTGPMLLLPLTNIIPDIDSSYSIRLWVYELSNNANQNNEQNIIAIETDSTAQRYEFDRYYNGGLIHYGRIVRNATSVVASDITGEPTHDVMVMELDKMGYSFAYLRTGVYSGGFPAIKNLKARAEMASPASPMFLPLMQTPANMYIALGAATGNATGDLIVKFGRLRVDVYF